MSRKDDARPHLVKAEEYLEAARLVLAQGLANAACSLAVTSAINAKDVVCILSVGRTGKSDDHARAVDELKRSGPVGAAMAQQLGRVLSTKGKSQYSPAAMTSADAEQAVTRAARLLGDARALFDTVAG